MDGLAATCPSYTGLQSGRRHRTIEPSNVYPRVASAAVESEHPFLDSTEADMWNESLAKVSKPSDLDDEVYKTAQEQSVRGLLSKPMSKAKVKAQVDFVCGKGR